MVVIFTPDEVLRIELEVVGFDHCRQNNVHRNTNLSRFKSHYGSLPIVYAQIWEDFQTTEVAEARIAVPKLVDFDYFLMAIHFLKCYPTEKQQEGIFKCCEKTARKWAWYYSTKMQALKVQKVSFLCVLDNPPKRYMITNTLLLALACAVPPLDCLAGAMESWQSGSE
jgi:hypothetical protein